MQFQIIMSCRARNATQNRNFIQRNHGIRETKRKSRKNNNHETKRCSRCEIREYLTKYVGFIGTVLLLLQDSTNTCQLTTN